MNESEAATTGSGEANEGTRPAVAIKPDRSINPRRNPPADSLKELTDEHKQVIELMVYGLDEGGTIDGTWFDAGEPLPFRNACLAIGARLRRMREMYATPLFQAALNREIGAQRNAERPRNLQVAKQIRDDEGDGSAAMKTVRLKAIQTIEGRDGSTSVNVQINNNAQVNVVPGYVIKLRAPAETASPSAKIIEGEIETREASDG